MSKLIQSTCTHSSHLVHTPGRECHVYSSHMNDLTTKGCWIRGKPVHNSGQVFSKQCSSRTISLIIAALTQILIITLVNHYPFLLPRCSPSAFQAVGHIWKVLNHSLTRINKFTFGKAGCCHIEDATPGCLKFTNKHCDTDNKVNWINLIYSLGISPLKLHTIKLII